MEGCADGVHEKAREGRLPPTCYHETRGRGGALKRTKFFFGARCELQLPIPSYHSIRRVAKNFKRLQVLLVIGAKGVWL